MSSVQTVTTKHHTVEVDRDDYLLIKNECKKLGVTVDYYFFEFQYYQDEN